jgi:hypothetical protein
MKDCGPKDHYFEFYASIGHAISQWAHVEDALCRVYISAIGLNHRKVASPYRLPATAAFHAIISPDAKAQMAHASISIHLMQKGGDESEALLEEWNRIFKRVTERLRARNQLAHFQTLINTQDSPERQHTLRPRIFDPTLLLKYRSEKEIPVFRTNDIEQVRRSFGRLSMDISAFTEKFEKDPPASFD